MDELIIKAVGFLTGNLDEGQTPVENPWHGDTVDDETRPMLGTLIEINQRGFVTIESQPGTDDEARACVGEQIGCKLWTTQRAYISGLIHENKAEEFIKKLREEGLLVSAVNPAKPWTRTLSTGVEELLVNSPRGGMVLPLTYERTGGVRLRDIAKLQEACTHSELTNERIDAKIRSLTGEIDQTNQVINQVIKNFGENISHGVDKQISELQTACQSTCGLLGDLQYLHDQHHKLVELSRIPEQARIPSTPCEPWSRLYTKSRDFSERGALTEHVNSDLNQAQEAGWIDDKLREELWGVHIFKRKFGEPGLDEAVLEILRTIA